MSYMRNDLRIVQLLKGTKQEVIVESMHLFQGSYKDIKDMNKVQQTLEMLFDLFLLNITSNEYSRFTSFGEIVERYRETEQMQIEEFLKNFEKIRAFIEKKILTIPVEGTEKAETIAKLNKFFLDLQKQAYIETINEKNKDILEKDIRLSQLNKERSEILAKLSMSFAHEIRNPLTSIKGFVQLLEKRSTLVEEKKYFDIIYHDMNSLEQQVNQFLFLSNEKNHEDFSFHSVYLDRLLYDVVNSFQTIFSEHNIYVELNLGESVSTLGSEEQVKMILFKLIENALDALLLKSQERILRINLMIEGEEMIVTISNNGPPIPSIMRQSMFEPFVGTKELGKGLGLAVSKQLMKKHEGAIDFLAVDEWTIFKLRFPINNGLVSH